MNSNRRPIKNKQKNLWNRVNSFTKYGSIGWISKDESANLPHIPFAKQKLILAYFRLFGGMMWGSWITKCAGWLLVNFVNAYRSLKLVVGSLKISWVQIILRLQCGSDPLVEVRWNLLSSVAAIRFCSIEFTTSSESSQFHSKRQGTLSGSLQ